MDVKQFICMNWGDAYGAEYVNRLNNMIRRNTTGDVRVICLTESDQGISSEVECYDCPTIDIPEPHCNRGWRKVTLWKETVPGLETGSQALFIDLDTVILDSLDPFFDHDGDFIVCENWSQPGSVIGNTSVYRFTVGSHQYLYDTLVNDTDNVLAKYPNSQTYISRTVKEGAMSFWPDPWCQSYKIHCVPNGVKRWFIEPSVPKGTRIVAFPGSPNPHEALKGEWPAPWFKKIYKTVKPSQWIADNWR